MADLKISQLPSASIATGSNVLPIVQGGITDQITVTNLAQGMFNLNLPITGSFTGSINGAVVNNTAWASYVPIWTSNGTQPVLGNGDLSGAYKVIGKTCFVRLRLALGTTSTGGTGHWLFSLPITASNPDGIQFPCSMLDNGNAWYQGTVNGTYAGHTDKTAIIVASGGGASSSEGVTSTKPFVWGAADSLQFNGSYEIA